MRREARILPLLLAVMIFLTLCACARTKGTATEYDGFTVRTEKTQMPGERVSDRAESLRNADGSAQEDYVLNKSSHKFHYPWCGSVGEISEKNRWDYRGTRESVIDMGYEPCKSCDP